MAKQNLTEDGLPIFTTKNQTEDGLPIFQKKKDNSQLDSSDGQSPLPPPKFNPADILNAPRLKPEDDKYSDPYSEPAKVKPKSTRPPAKVLTVKEAMEQMNLEQAQNQNLPDNTVIEQPVGFQGYEVRKNAEGTTTVQPKPIEVQKQPSLPEGQEDYAGHEAQNIKPFNAIVKGATNIVGDMAKSVAILSKNLNLFGEYGYEGFASEKKVTDLATYKWGQWLQTEAADLFPTNDVTNEEFIGKLAQGAGSMVPFIFGGLIGQFTKYGKYAVPTTMGAMSNAASQYQDAISHGADDETAFKSYLLGFVTGAPEGLPIGSFMSRMNKITQGGLQAGMRSAARKGTFGVNGISEGFQEWFTDFANNASAKILYDESRNILEGTFESGAMGFLLGETVETIGRTVAEKLADPNLKPYDRTLLEETQKYVQQKAELLKDVQPTELVGGNNDSQPVQELKKQKLQLESDIADPKVTPEVKIQLTQKVQQIDEQIANVKQTENETASQIVETKAEIADQEVKVAELQAQLPELSSASQEIVQTQIDAGFENLAQLNESIPQEELPLTTPQDDKTIQTTKQEQPITGSDAKGIRENVPSSKKPTWVKGTKAEVEAALKNNDIHKAIGNGSITAKEAETLLKDNGIIVPKDIKFAASGKAKGPGKGSVPAAKRAIKGDRKIASEIDVHTPLDHVLQFISKGGRITYKMIKEIYGEKAALAEKNARINYVGSGETTVDGLSHQLYENAGSPENYTSQDFKEALLYVIGKHQTPSAAAKQLLERYKVDTTTEIDNQTAEQDYEDNLVSKEREKEGENFDDNVSDAVLHKLETMSDEERAAYAEGKDKAFDDEVDNEAADWLSDNVEDTDTSTPWDTETVPTVEQTDTTDLNKPDYSKEVKSMSKAEFVAKMGDKFDSKEEAGQYWSDTRDAIFTNEVDTLKREINDELKDSRNNLSMNPIGSTKMWAKMAKMMGLYFEKGVTKVEDFAKAAGYKLTKALKDLWNSITGRKKTPTLKAARNTPMTSLNSRLYYTAALQNIGTNGTPEQIIESIKKMIETFDVMAIHSSERDAANIAEARESLRQLYQELSQNQETVQARIDEEINLGYAPFALGTDLNTTEKALLALEDDMLWQRKAQKEIEKAKQGEIPDNQNPYMLRDIAIGKIKNAIDKVYQKIFGKQFGQLGTSTKTDKSLLGRMKSDKLSQNDLDLFMYASHAKERNARVRKMRENAINDEILANDNKIAEWQKTPNDPAAKAQITRLNNKNTALRAEPIPQEGSGMSDAKADEILAEFQRAGKFDKLAEYSKEFRETVIKPTIDAYEEAGLITPEEAEMLRNGESESTGVKFENYVPLKVNEGMIADAKGSSLPSISSPLKSIKGTDKYDYLKRNSPFAQSLLDFKKGVKVAEDNKTHKALYDLVKENPNSQVWDIVPATFTEGTNGQMNEITDIEVRQNSVPVKVNGTKYYIHLKHPGLLKAWQGAFGNLPEFVKIIGNILRTFNNFKRGILTQWNPVFGSKNLIRDIQDAIFNSSGLNIPFSGAKIVKNIPKMMGGLLKASFGNLDPNSSTGKILDDYLAAGGKVSWLDYDKIENEMANIRRMSSKFNKTGLADVPKRFFKATLATISGINESIEIATRLSVFKFLKQEGYSSEKAASISKNMTVNFNKKGQMTPLVNTMYLFSNAGIQANMTGIRNVIKSKKAKKYAVGTALLGLAYPFIQEYLINMLSDDDEEKERYKKLISDEEKQGQIVIPIGDNRVWRIPKTYGIARFFFNIGEEAGNFVMGGDAERRLGNMFETLTGVLDPIGGNTPNPYSAYTPTIAKPFVEIAMNAKWNNTPIYPHQGFGIPKPDSERYFDSVNPYMRDFTSSLYGKTNGKIDVSPETLEYFFEDLTGGVIKELKNATGEVMNVFDGKAVDKNKLPFYGTFITDISTQQWRYTKLFYDLYNEAAKRKLTPQEMKDLQMLGSKSGMDKTALNKKVKQIKKEQKELDKDD